LRGLQRFLALHVVKPERGSEPEAPMTTNQQGHSPAAAISAAAVQLLREYTGRGPTRSRTHINQDSVMVLVGDTLTRGERKLVEAGQAERVLQLRHDYQMVMRNELTAAVEGALDRKVIAFMSQNHIDPDMACEVFVLEPKPQVDS
jgi:uncharacterized protein YbcI